MIIPPFPVHNCGDNTIKQVMNKTCKNNRHYYRDNEYFSDKIVSQRQLAKTMYSSSSNSKSITDYRKKICNLKKSFEKIKEFVSPSTRVDNIIKFSISRRIFFDDEKNQNLLTNIYIYYTS